MSSSTPQDPESTDRASMTPEAEVATYLAAVRTHLSDLEFEELEEVTEDLELHLAEVQAEANGPLATVLGEPAQFAAELRASAGFAVVPPPPPKQTVTGRIEASLASVQTHAWVRAVRDFLPELRPAWWVARGYLLVVLAAELTGQAFDTFPFPALWGSGLAGLIATGFAVVASVRLGRLDRVGGWKQRGALVAGILAVLGGLVTTASANSGEPIYYDEVGVRHAQPIVDMTILPANIYAYDLEGNSLGQVLLFNEEGQPIHLPRVGFSERAGLEFETTMPLDATGQEIPNLYPRDMIYFEWGENGMARQRQALPPIVGFPVLADPPAADLPADTEPAAELDPPPEDIDESVETAPVEPVRPESDAVDSDAVDSDDVETPDDVETEVAPTELEQPEVDPGSEFDDKTVPPDESADG